MLRIKDLREEKNILQRDLALAINRTRACISSWEQGKTEPSIDDLLKLADFFDVSIDCLVGRDGFYLKPLKKTSAQESEALLTSLFRNMSQEYQMRLVGYAEALSQLELSVKE